MYSVAPAEWADEYLLDRIINVYKWHLKPFNCVQTND